MILLFLVAAIAPLIISDFKFSFPYVEQLIATGLPAWIWVLSNFDGVHYLSIAQSWYGEYFTQAFFPLYPLLIRIIIQFLPFLELSWTSTLIMGLILSNIAFLMSLFLFWKLLRMDASRSTTQWSLAFLLTFPTAFFFGAVYSESLFFLLVLAAFLFARQKKWFLSAIIIGLASGTRVIGILLLPAILYEYTLSFPKETLFFWGARRHQNLTIKDSGADSGQARLSGRQAGMTTILKVLLKSLKYFWIAPLGLLSYIAFQWWKLGHPFFFLYSQTQFGGERLERGIVLLPQVFWRYFKILATVPINQYDFYVGLWEFLFTLFGFGVLLLGFRMNIRRSYLIFALLALLLPTLSGTLSSMPRYLLVAFPIFLILAHIKSTWVKAGLAMFFLALQLLFITLFTRGWWVA